MTLKIDASRNIFFLHREDFLMDANILPSDPTVDCSPSNEGVSQHHPDLESCSALNSGGIEEEKERSCDSLRMCIVTTLNQGKNKLSLIMTKGNFHVPLLCGVCFSISAMN